MTNEGGPNGESGESAPGEERSAEEVGGATPAGGISVAVDGGETGADRSPPGGTGGPAGHGGGGGEGIGIERGTSVNSSVAEHPHPHSNGAPVPFDSAEFETHDRRASKRKIAVCAVEDEEAGTIGRGGSHARECSAREPKVGAVVEVRDGALGDAGGPADGARRVGRSDALDSADVADEENSIPAPDPDPNRESEVSGPTIPVTEAYLVHGQVILATPLRAADPPAADPYIWWKQPNAQRFLVLICLVATAPAVTFGVYLSNNDSEPGIEAAAPTVPPSISPSPTSSPTPSCIACNNIPTPWMINMGYECATAPNWLIEANCIDDRVWVNNNNCEKRCQDDGYGYHRIRCCTSSD